MNNLQRERFEKYCNLWRLPLGINENGFYEEAITQRHWNTWCAAIESVVVELPKLCDGENSCKCYYESESVENALDKAGIKYE